MRIGRCWAAVLLAGLMLGCGIASAQNFPDKPVRFVVAVPGSAPDIIARAIAQQMTQPLGQPVIVENRPVILIVDTLKRSAPDGHTIALGGTSIWTTPLLQKTSYDAEKDLAPVTVVASFPYILVVHPSLPAKSVRDLVALAKSKPGALNYAQGPPAGGVHLAGALFKTLAGIDMAFIPYNGAALGVNATISGETQFIIYNAVGLMPHVKSGRLRALGVSSAEPSALAPGIPPIAKVGVPGYEYVSMLGVFATAGTPELNINRLNQEIVRALGNADIKDKVLGLGADVVGSTPAQFAARVKTELVTMSKVIKEAGIKIEQ